MDATKLRKMAEQHGIGFGTLYKARRRLGISTVGKWALA
jgi:hypothetical protein